MRNRILGGIGVMWGGGILLYGLFKADIAGGAYGGGQVAGLVFGALFFATGLYYLIKGPVRTRA